MLESLKVIHKSFLLSIDANKTDIKGTGVSK